MLFSKRLTPAPPLVLCLEATIQGQGPSFQAELIPVRSPLLRESYLVPFPPLTYMLKFSGFADLTSCCAGDSRSYVRKLFEATQPADAQECTSQVADARAIANPECATNSAQKTEPWHTKTQAHPRWTSTCMRIPQALKQAYSQGYPESAMHVQRSIGSRNSAIHNDYHTSLRPSSVLEPRYPSLKVVMSKTHRSCAATSKKRLLNQSRSWQQEHTRDPEAAGVPCHPRAPEQRK
jgi:hypothetical protein